MSNVQSGSKGVLPQAIPDISLKGRLYGAPLTEPAVNTEKELAPSFMELFLAIHIFAGAAGVHSWYRLWGWLWKYWAQAAAAVETAFKTLLDLRNGMSHALADLSVMTNANVEKIVWRLLATRTSTLESHIMNFVEFTFRDSLQESFLSLNNGLKASVYKLVEQELDEVVWSSRAPTVFEAEMQSIDKTDFGAKTFIPLVPFNSASLS